MAIRMEKPWQALTRETVERLPGQLGVYQIADRNGEFLLIGFAGGRSLFGLRGEIETQCDAEPGAPDRQFRYEVNTQYWSRYQELLMVYIADHGEPPSGNADSLPSSLGRLDPL